MPEPARGTADEAAGERAAGTGDVGEEPGQPGVGTVGEEPGEPGVGEAIGGVRAAFRRMLDAHVALLRAELELTGREIGIIAGLALGALAIAVLALILLYVGSFLFFGELLFGSMGWGIIHGVLIAAAVIGFVVVNLGGGEVERYGLGFAIGLGAAIVIAALLLSNIGNTGGESLRDWLEATFVTEDLPFGEAWLVTLGGLVIGGLIGLVVALIGGWRSDLRGRPLAGIGIVGFILGGFIGAVWTSTRYDAPDGVLGLAITIGLLTWIIAGLVLAARRGFDPEARYANLIPRESMAAFEKTRDFLTDQWEHQKNRMMGR
ncbi:MAG: phage holin family protein [Chloroflexota bacterium]